MAEIVRILPSPSPSQLRRSAARGSEKIFGVTTSVFVASTDFVLSTSPNVSATWIRSGPTVNLPRAAGRSW